MTPFNVEKPAFAIKPAPFNRPVLRITAGTQII